MDPKTLLDRFSTHLKNVVTKAIALANALNHREVTPSHLLICLAEEEGSVGAEILSKLEIKKEAIYRILDIKPNYNKEHPSESPTVTATIPPLDVETKSCLERAMLVAYERGHSHIGTEHLLWAIIKIKEPEIEALWDYFKINKETIGEQIENVLQSTSKFPDVDDVSGVMEQMQEMIEQNAGLPLSSATIVDSKNKKRGMNAVDIFTTDLTNAKQQKNIDPVIGREKEIERLINILCRRHKNNPILVGEPGVGKTAIVEGLAKKISLGDVPDILKRKKILALDMPLLLAGTIYRGEFEARLKQIIDEIIKSPEVILFIDELHNIIGAGSSQGAMDAANILKPALARGQLRCIGATTIDEYKKHISSDPALERRFQSIQIDEPSKEQTIEILKGLKKYYEDFHHTIITPEAIAAAVRLSEKYIHDNFLPDKAIDLIDEACASVKVKQKSHPLENKRHKLLKETEELAMEKEKAVHEEKFEQALQLKKSLAESQSKLNKLENEIKKEKKIVKKKVDLKDIAHILETKLNINANIILANEWEELNTLGERLKKQIIGQDEVIKILVKNLRQANLGLRSAKKPLTSFLFVGPSGVGKTELAKILARELYHDEKAIIKLDMGEFSEQHGVSKLLGSPAGYIGYKDRNRFIDEIKKRPYCVVLFDEFDKAHKDVNKILMTILDEGELTDSTGKKTNFNHAIIILTTNLGAEYFKSAGIGFNKTTGYSSTSTLRHNQKTPSADKIMNKLKEEFGAALLGRLDEICIFSPLSKEDVEKIIVNKIDNLNNQLKATRQMNVKPDQKALESLLIDSFNEDVGARNVDRMVEDVVQELVIKILQEKQRKTNYLLTKQAEGYKLK